ncbi:MAG TPA: alpha/beta hydrolase [Baekduia sp.]|nr:alpha/beta hydrolase [Baekduia sp.]
MTPRVAAWRGFGRPEAVGGHRLHVHERPGDGPLHVFLHGFPSSSFDWRGVLDRLPGRRALAFDFLGFGLSDKPREHVYTLAWQADAVEELVRRAGAPPVVLVAHDMGTSVATELLARDVEGRLSIDVGAVLLFNGSILLDRATLTPGQRLLRSPAGPLAARLTTARSFRLQFARLFSPAHPLSREEAADQWALLREHDGHRLLHRTIHYLGERERLADRWHGAVRDWPGPLSFAWGLRDPVATTRVLDGLRELRPLAPVRELPELGHYPQIEDPSAIAAEVEQVTRRAPDRP